jgi:hypothetical protein
MIQLIEDAPEGVLAFKAVGKVEAADYDAVLKPAVEKALADGKKARIVFEMGPEFEGYSAGAAWEDAKLWAPHLTDWERVAVVTNHSFMAGALRTFGAIMPGEIKVFPDGELAQALDWAAA